MGNGLFSPVHPPPTVVWSTDDLVGNFGTGYAIPGVCFHASIDLNRLSKPHRGFGFVQRHFKAGPLVGFHPNPEHRILTAQIVQAIQSVFRQDKRAGKGAKFVGPERLLADDLTVGSP